MLFRPLLLWQIVVTRLVIIGSLEHRKKRTRLYPKFSLELTHTLCHKVHKLQSHRCMAYRLTKQCPPPPNHNHFTRSHESVTIPVRTDMRRAAYVR